MNLQQIEFLKSLDPQGLYGTLSEVLLNPDVTSIPYVKALEFLFVNCYNERKTLIEENVLYANLLKKAGLYTNENIIPKEKQ